MDTALLIGIVGTVLACASLAWQVITWRNSGPRVRVRFMWGIPLGRPGRAVQLRGIEVTNVGRASTVVTGVSVRLPDKRHFPLVADALRQVSFPRELGGGESFTAYYEVDAVESGLRDHGYPPSTVVRPLARTGHGVALGKGVKAQ